MKLLKLAKQVIEMKKALKQIEMEEEYERIDNMTLEELQEYSKQIKDIINEVKK